MTTSTPATSQDTLSELRNEAFGDKPASLADLQAAANQKTVNMLKTAQDYYSSKPLPTDQDMVELVRSKLVEAGVQNIAEVYDADRHVQDAVGRRPHAQVYHLNRFFAEQFAIAQNELGVDTRQDRYCIIHEVTAEQWKKIMEDKLIPSLVSTGIYNEK